ncbi:MAG: SGNH/GDSL hydrolase family protein [Bacteroidia bacterium]|nr:SGNH/GDSL hydrolase family protein [Bacteroidia bacterium]
MRRMFLLILGTLMVMYLQAQDWANLEKYRSSNMEIKHSNQNDHRIVLIGNSITEGWSTMSPEWWVGKPYINRGIGGQTTPQMLIRFRPDVIELDPTVVVILAGTNDIAGNTGPMTIAEIFGNIQSMVELAVQNDIEVVLSSVLPAQDYPWRPGLRPDQKIPELNKMLKEYANDHGIIYLDYFNAMADDRNGLPPDLAEDGVHPTVKGYRVMEALAEKAIAQALKKVDSKK